MDLKILYGGLDRSSNKLIEDLIEQSPKNLVGVNLGTKVTKVALKRKLQDATVSIVLLNETDHTTMTASLSDDRLVCIIDEYSIQNIFESRYGVSDSVEEEQEESLEDEDFNLEDLHIEGLQVEEKIEVPEDGDTDLNMQDSFDESNEEETTENTEDVSWDKLLESFDSIGLDDSDEDESDNEEEPLEEELGYSLEDESEEQKPEVLEIPIEEESEEDVIEVEVQESEAVAGLRQVIRNLKQQIQEQEEFISGSVSLDDFVQVQGECRKLEEQNTILASSKQQLERESLQLKEETERLQKESNQYESIAAELNAKVEKLEEEQKQAEEVKAKFLKLMDAFGKQKEQLDTLKKNSGKPKLGVLKKRFPNITFIVPMSSNSVVEMYEYMSQRLDNTLFIDLSNNSYVDKHVKGIIDLVRPSKWLFEGLHYKDTLADMKNRSIKLITSVSHQLDKDFLLKVNWEKTLTQLSLERKVVINIGSIYDNNVIDTLIALQDGIKIECYYGSEKRDKRIGSFAKTYLKKNVVDINKG